MRRFAIYLIFLCFPMFSHGENPLECLNLTESAQKMAQSEISAKSITEIQNEDYKLLVIGERHYQHYFFKIDELFSKFKVNKRGKVCFFAELQSHATKQDIDEAIQGKYNEIFFSRTRLNFGSLFAKIRKLGWKIVPVDAPMTKEEAVTGARGSMPWYTMRDTHMLEGIQKNLDSPDCDFGFFLVGGLHVKSVPGVYKSLAKRLKDKIGKSQVKVVETIYNDELKYPRCGSGWQGYSVPSFISQIGKYEEGFTTDGFQSHLDVDYLFYLNPIHSPSLIGTRANPKNPFFNP